MTDEKINVFYVKNNFDSGLGSLRAAVDMANLSPNLKSKIYFDLDKDFVINLTSGEILVESNITLVNKMCNKVTISSNLTSRIFHVALVPDVSYFKIKGGKGIVLQNGITDSYGGAIYSEPAESDLILQNVKIFNSSANISGGAIYTLGRLTLIGCKIVKNTANNLGGGIYCNQTVNVIKSNVDHNTILIPLTSSGAGGIFVDNGDLILNESSVSFNKVASLIDDQPTGGSGGAIVVMNGSVYVQNCSRVNNNSAYNSGGIQQGIGNVIVSNQSTVSNNKSYNRSTGSAGGGAITIMMGVVHISDSEILNNSTVGMYSGGIVSLVGDVIINSSTISKNINKGPGGGIAVNVGSVSVNQSKITHNVSSSIGGGIVNFAPGPKYIIVDNSVISHNVVDNNQTVRQTIEAFLQTIRELVENVSAQASLSDNFGSLVFLANVPVILEKITHVNDRLHDIVDFFQTPTVVGGGIGTLLSTFVTVNNSNISNNFVGKIASELNVPFNTFGGGLYGFDAVININNSLFTNNRSKDNAGAVYSKRSLVVSNSKFSENRVGVDGGAIYNDLNGKATVVDSEVICNVSENNGGGVYNRSNIEFINSKIIYNTAKVNGGGLYTVPQFIKTLTVIKYNKPDNIFVERLLD